MENNGVILEFFSLPGSGKTTISNLLIDELKSLGIRHNHIALKISEKKRIVRLLIKLLFVLKFFLFRPIFFFKNSLLIILSNQRNITVLIKVLINYFYIASILYFAKVKNEFVILDQGILQAIWSINITARNEIDSNKLLSLEIKPNIVVSLKVEINNISKRLRERFVKEQNCDIEQYMEQLPIFLEEYNKMLKDYNYETIMLMKNNSKNELKENVRKILNYLNESK